MRPLWPRPWECTFQNSLQAPKQKWMMCVDCNACSRRSTTNQTTTEKPSSKCGFVDWCPLSDAPTLILHSLTNAPLPAPQQCAAHSRNMLVERQKTCYQTTVKNHQLRVDRTYYSSNGNEDLFASSTQLMWFVPFQCLYTLRPECATKATRIFDDDGDDDDDASLCLSVGLATVATCQNSFAGLFELRC